MNDSTDMAMLWSASRVIPPGTRIEKPNENLQVIDLKAVLARADADCPDATADIK